VSLCSLGVEIELSSYKLEWTEIGIGPDDVNLQTKKLHYNYSVLIGSPE